MILFFLYIIASFIIFLGFTFILGEMETDLKDKLEYRIQNYEEFKKE